MVSTHGMAIIETHSKSPAETGPGTIPRISKADMAKPINWGEEDDIVTYIGTDKPLPPTLPPCNLPDEFYAAQEIAYERASEMDFKFLQVYCDLHI